MPRGDGFRFEIDVPNLRLPHDRLAQQCPQRKNNMLGLNRTRRHLRQQRRERKKFSLSNSVISTSLLRRNKRFSCNAVVAPAKPLSKITIRTGTDIFVSLDEFRSLGS